MKIAFLGDIAVLEERSLQNGEQYFRKVAEYLKGFDCVICNLEAAVTPRTTTWTPKSMHLRTDERIITILRQLHVDCVVLANNHVGDYGRKGLMDTVLALKSAGIPYVGVDGTVWRVTMGDSKLSLSGFCCYSANGSQYSKTYSGQGICALSEQAVLEQLEKDRQEGYFSLLSFHWGDEFTYYPNHRQLAFARRVMNRDNVMIYGHHTHVMSGYERRGNALCAYSLGNFYFDRCVSPIIKNFVVEQLPENRESYILEVTFDGNTIQEVHTTGIYADEQELHLIDNREKVQQISAEISAETAVSAAYRDRRAAQIASAKQKKFAKHDLKWFLSKMNYYSICSRLLTYRNKYRYDRAF